MSTAGIRLKRIRQALSLSQEEFGAILGATKSYVSLVEKDKSKLSVDNLVKLLLDYNVNLNYLLGGLGEPFNPKPFEDVRVEILKEVDTLLKKRGL